MLEVGPYQAWLTIQREKVGSASKLGEVIGISHKKVESIIRGINYDKKKDKEITHVDLDLVDLSAVRSGIHISEIYPDYHDWPELHEEAV